MNAQPTNARNSTCRDPSRFRGIVEPFVRLPRVSVCIGCFNQAQFVEKAIRSVAAQTYVAFDCVVVDDLSSDGTRDLIQSCLTNLGDERFRFISRPHNGGQMATMMTGLDATGGPLVAFLDGDDVWHPTFLECHVGAHLSGAGIAAISSSDELLIDSTDAVLAGGYPGFRRSDPRLSKASSSQILRVHGEADETIVFLDRGVTDWLWSTTSGMMFRRDAIVAMRPPDPTQIRICADYYLAHAAHMIGGTVRLEKVLGSYRLHNTNGWAKKNVLGEGTELARLSAEVAEGIRRILAEQWCAIAPELEPMLSHRSMRRTLVDYLGWAAALDLFKTNAPAALLLEDWASPWRRWLLNLARCLPRKLRPRHLRGSRTAWRGRSASGHVHSVNQGPNT
jgi:glycosyltransferase involved in cell wall biosynthesis